MELNDQQRVYIQTISNYFSTQGKWPTYSYIDRQLSRISRKLDIVEISKSLPIGFAGAFRFIHDLNAPAILSIPALHRCLETRDDLENFLQVIQFCVDRFFQAEKDPVEITSSDIKQSLNLPDLSIRKVGLLIKDMYDFPIYQSFSAKDPEYNQWICVLSRNIRYLDGITSIDQYLAKLDEMKKPQVNSENNQSQQLQKKNPVSSKKPQVSGLTVKNAFLFEMMASELLQALGYTNIIEAEEKGDRGYDFLACLPINSAAGIVTQQVWLIQIKYLQNNRISSNDINNLLATAQHNQVDKVLLITNVNLSSFTLDRITKIRQDTGNKLEIWDRDHLMQLLNPFPDIKQRYNQVISQFPGSLSNSLGEKKTTLIQELANCQPGRPDAYKFENICISILSEVFVPPLKTPKIQARTLNGIERRDALFSLRGIKQGWEEIREEFDANFLLCEFKNYTDQFSQDEVNQTRNYLRSTIGKIGIIFSRKGASESAKRMRNSIYSQDKGKVILFLEDKHLIELLKMKEANQNPLDLIQAAIEDFLVSHE